MEPVTMALALGAAGNIAGGLMGSIGNASSNRELQERLRALQDKIEREWSLPEYDRTPLTLEEYQLLETYTPELALFIQEDSPDLLRNVPTEATQNRQEVMDRLKELSSEGTSATTKAAAERAELQATSAHKGRMNELMKTMSQRGLGGSAQELLAGVQGGANLAQGQRESALTEAENANQRRMQALQGLGSMSGQVANEERQTQAANTQALNDYKRRMTDRRQQYEAYRTGTTNEANKYNQQNRQNVANANVGLRNQGTMYNKEKENEYNREKSRSMNERLKLLTGMGTQSAQSEYSGNIQQNQATAGMIGAGGNLLGGIAGSFGSKGKSSPGAAGAFSKDYMTPWEEENWYGRPGSRGA